MMLCFRGWRMGWRGMRGEDGDGVSVELFR